jgi:predicted O-methyltransferase YrrM
MIIPKIFRKIPASLKVVDKPATAEEMVFATATRKRYIVPGESDPYMVDVIRALRLLRGAKRYVEVGTRDRGNIAVVAQIMGSNPIIVDVDYDRLPANEVAIQKEFEGKAKYTFIHGDSVAPATVARVSKAIGKQRADVIFCDSSHMYEHTLAEFEHYFDLVRPGGFLMYHDAMWEGSATDKGKHQALMAIDRFMPVYVVVGDEPVHRILSRSSKGDVWGCVAIIPKKV